MDILIAFGMAGVVTVLDLLRGIVLFVFAAQDVRTLFVDCRRRDTAVKDGVPSHTS